MDYKNIKLIGLDLDGTLLHDDKTISDRTINAIKKANELGIHIVPITGRPIAGIPDFIINMPEIRYMIYNNGSQIVDGDKTLFKFSLDKEKSVEIMNSIKSLGSMVEVFVDGWGYIEPYVDDFYHSVIPEDTPIGQYIYSSRRVCDSVEDIVKNGDCINEIFVICPNEDSRVAIVNFVKELNGVNYWTLDPIFVEITKENTNKGVALKTLCNLLDIDVCDTIAFGDGENDLPFLDMAGVAVAMENAPDVVKRSADIITDTNENDGVAMIIEEIINSQK